MDEAGRPARSRYYIEWERRASATSLRGPHLLLFSPGYIEVRNFETGELVELQELHDLHLLRSGLTDWSELIGVIFNKEDNGSQTQKLVELVYHGK